MVGIPGEAETSRNEHHASTAACLCRSIRASLLTIFEGRRRTWREIRDRLSRFAGVGAHRIGHGDRIAVLMLKPGSLHRLLPDRQLGGHRDRAPQHPLEYPGWGSSICAHTAGVEPSDPVDSRAHRRETSAGRDISADDPDKNALMAIFLAWTRRVKCSAQVLGTRMNEIYLYRSPRPIRSLHSAVGWTTEAIAEHALPALKPSFMPIDRSGDAFYLDLL